MLRWHLMCSVAVIGLGLGIAPAALAAPVAPASAAKAAGQGPLLLAQYESGDSVTTDDESMQDEAPPPDEAAPDDQAVPEGTDDESPDDYTSGDPGDVPNAA